MPNIDDLKPDELSKSLQDLNEKMNEFSSIIQKFGLDLITKLGQTNSHIKMLTDKIDKLDKTTLDIKALMPKLTNIIDNQNILESDIDLIKSLIQRTNRSSSKNDQSLETIERDESITKNKQFITDQFKELSLFIEETKDINEIKRSLQKIKDTIFELTGGHKILYEISQALNKLNGTKDLSDLVRYNLKEKIDFWIAKIKSAPFKKKTT